MFRTETRDVIEVSKKYLDTYQDDFSKFNVNTINDVALSIDGVFEETNVEVGEPDNLDIELYNKFISDNDGF